MICVVTACGVDQYFEICIHRCSNRRQYIGLILMGTGQSRYRKASAHGRINLSSISFLDESFSIFSS